MKKFILILLWIAGIAIPTLKAQVKAFEIKNEINNDNLFSVLSDGKLQVGNTGMLQVIGNDLQFSSNNSTWQSLTAGTLPSTVLHRNVPELVTGNFIFENDLTVENDLVLGKLNYTEGELKIYSDDDDPFKMFGLSGGQYAEMGLKNSFFFFNLMGGASMFYFDDDVITDGDIILPSFGSIEFRSGVSSSSSGSKIYSIDAATINGSPVMEFEVHNNGTIRFSSDVCYSQSFSSCSDRRYKKDITKLTAVLDKIAQLNGVAYDWRIDEFPDMGFADERQLGVIAQDVEAAGFPELVKTDASGYKSVDYTKLSVVLIEGVKELHQEQKDLKNTVIDLATDYEELESQQVMLFWLVGGFGSLMLLMIAIGLFWQAKRRAVYQFA